MVFPATPLPVVVEAMFDGTTWTTITGDVYVRDGIEITRGQANEASKAEPSKAALTLNARSGNYSPRNPTGTHYGLIGRNTPLRLSVDQATSYLSIDAATGTTPAAGCSVTTPDAAALDITGDIDLRFDADLASWREQMELVTKWTVAGNQRSYFLVLLPAGTLNLFTSSDGTATVNAVSTVPVPVTTGRLAVRVTLDVDNGAGGRTTTFYTSDTIGGTWTQLGDPVVAAGTTSIFSGSGVLVVLDNPNSSNTASIIRGRVLAAQVRNGIAGTVVANPDFTVQAHGATSFVDSTAKTWTLTGVVSLQKRDYRSVGEVPAWPTRWDLSQKDVWAPITADGIMRRLGTGASPLRSPMYAGSIKLASLLAYWPCEDGSDSARFGSAVTGGFPLIPAGQPGYATNSEFQSSAALPEFSGAKVTGRIGTYTNTGALQIRFLFRIPAGGAANTSIVARVTCSGTIARWDLTYGTGGTLALSAWDSDGTLITSSGAVAFAVDGKLLRGNIQLATNGADVDYTFGTLEVGASLAGGSSGTVTGRTLGKITSLEMNPKNLLTDTVFGHITVQSLSSNIFDLASQLKGYAGERAGRRFQRLCRENGLDHVILGAADATEPLGVQRPLTLLDLLRECATVDGGLMFEPRDFLGLALRTRESLQSQPATVTVPYACLVQLEPVDDDTNVINDVTVSRPNGASARAVRQSGPLSVLEPPNGVGLYDTALEVNVASDDQLPDQAGRRMALGTVDEPRYPAVTLKQENSSVAANAALLAQLVVLDLGDRIDVSGPLPAWLPPETISQLTLGSTETLYPFERELTLVCVPESPYRVTQYASTTALAAAGVPPAAGRYYNSGTTLTGSENSTDTSWAITSPVDGRRWTTDPAQFPQDWMCEGERVRVTAISGTTNLQTATVQRSINGVVKAHSAGAVITPFQPAIYG